MDCQRVPGARPRMRAEVSLVGADEVKLVLFAIASVVGSSVGIAVARALVG